MKVPRNGSVFRLPKMNVWDLNVKTDRQLLQLEKKILEQSRAGTCLAGGYMDVGVLQFSGDASWEIRPHFFSRPAPDPSRPSCGSNHWRSSRGKSDHSSISLASPQVRGASVSFTPSWSGESSRFSEVQKVSCRGSDWVSVWCIILWSQLSASALDCLIPDFFCSVNVCRTWRDGGWGR